MACRSQLWIFQGCCSLLFLVSIDALGFVQIPWGYTPVEEPREYDVYAASVRAPRAVRAARARAPRARAPRWKPRGPPVRQQPPAEPRPENPVPDVNQPPTPQAVDATVVRSEDEPTELSDIKPVLGMAHEYGNHAASQRAYLQLLVPDILAHVKDGSVVFDLGAADGINTLTALQSMQAKTKNFSLGFVDLPANDWPVLRTQLKDTVHMIQPDNGYVLAPQSGLPSDGAGPTAVLVAGSFFDRVAPDEAVDIAICCTAVHYLTAGVKVKPVIQARDNWLAFLRWRAKELRSGGILLITGTAKRTKGEPVRSYHGANQVLGETLYDAMRKGMITAKTYKNWFFPSYSRTEEEWRRPFEMDEVPMLKLEKLQMVALPSPYWGMANGNATKFANLYVPSVMAWIGPYISSTLGMDVLRSYQQHLWKAVVQTPENFVADFLQAVMKIKKL